MRGSKPSGGAVTRPTVILPSGTSQGRPVSAPRLAAAPSTGPHISQPIRADLGKLTPELATGIRRVADSK
jgi:hypothetical protein